MSKTENKEIKRKLLTVAGTLVRCRWEDGYLGKGGKAWRVSVKLEKPISDEVRTEILKFMGITADDRFCPKWLKGEEEYINTHSKFDVPCYLKNGTQIDIAEVWEGAEVKLTLNIKPEGIYPHSILVLKNGEPYNPFEEIGKEGVLK